MERMTASHGKLLGSSIFHVGASVTDCGSVRPCADLDREVVRPPSHEAELGLLVEAGNVRVLAIRHALQDRVDRHR